MGTQLCRYVAVCRNRKGILKMLVFMLSAVLLGSDGLELSPEESIRASASVTDLHERLRILSRQKYPPASEMPAIIDLIRQSDSEASRLLALRALTAFQTRARQHIPTVVEMTDQKHLAVIRCAAIESLFRCGMESGELRKVLNAAIEITPTQASVGQELNCSRKSGLVMLRQKKRI